jgi:hypothetical protein
MMRSAFLKKETEEMEKVNILIINNIISYGVKRICLPAVPQGCRKHNSPTSSVTNRSPKEAPISLVLISFFALLNSIGLVLKSWQIKELGIIFAE